jgi:hypothetical protein
MHPPDVHAEVHRLIAEGFTDPQIARATGLARTTVRDLRARPAPALCPRCWRRIRPLGFTAGRYAELLGLYLGDGHIASAARSQRLRISLDARHAAIVGDVERLLRACFPHNQVGATVQDGGATVVPWVYSTHLRCLFPQAGAGFKHDRPIVLEPWQSALVDAAPFAFLRSCIHSDGSFFINRTGAYRYLSVEFTNVSDDIRRLFLGACERAGVTARENGRSVRIYRRDSVESLALFVGAKW